MAISKDLGRSIFKNFSRLAPNMVAPRGIRPPQTYRRSYAPDSSNISELSIISNLQMPQSLKRMEWI